MGGEIPDDVHAQIDPEVFAQSWAQAVSAPPSTRYRVMTAIEGAQVVGFAACGPAEIDMSGGKEAPPSIIEILALEVPQEHGRKGHGSRLLAAIADTAQAEEIQVWIPVGEESKTRFFHGAGFGPRGLQRTLQVGDNEINEQCWYAKLS